MIFQSITIKEGMFIREEAFSPKVNLIHSDDNSRGKTTFLRFLLYSIGFNIPSTRNIRFEQCEVTSTIVTDSGEQLILSRPNLNTLIVEQGSNREIYALPSQLKDIHAKIFNTTNEDILNNILGCMYADQEKGWTLLNRGKAIGSIHFNIEELIRGLTGRDCSDLIAEKERTQRELEKYRQISSIANYQSSLSESQGELVQDSYGELTDIAIESLLVQSKKLKKELKRVDFSLRDNSFFRRYIADMKLRIRLDSGEIITISEENFIGLKDSIDYLITKRNMISADIAKVESQIERKRREASKEQEQLTFIQSETVASVFDRRIAAVPIDAVAIASKVRELEKHLKELNGAITEKTRRGNKVADSMYETVIKYAQELGIGDETTMHSSYLYTSNLKELSGAILQKTVLAFRFAYIREVKQATGVKLPIILDSPRSREVDEKNTRMMTDIIKRDFPDNQVIIASIYDYDFDSLYRIEIESRLIDKPITQE